MAYLHSFVGNHPKPPGEREAQNEPSLDELGACAARPAPAQASAISCLCTTGPPVIHILWTLLTCRVYFSEASSLTVLGKGQPFHIVLSGFLQSPHQHAKLFHLVVYFFNVCEVLRTAPVYGEHGINICCYYYYCYYYLLHLCGMIGIENTTCLDNVPSLNASHQIFSSSFS